jgi:hypothetical protein
MHDSDNPAPRKTESYEAPRLEVLGDLHTQTQYGPPKILGHSDGFFFQPAHHSIS